MENTGNTLTRQEQNAKTGTQVNQASPVAYPIVLHVLKHFNRHNTVVLRLCNKRVHVCSGHRNIVEASLCCLLQNVHTLR